MRKNLDPNIKLEKQHANPIKGSVAKSHIGQGRAGLKRKRSDPINHTINQPSELSQKIPGKTEIETAHSKDPTYIINNVDAGMTHTKPLIPDVPFHQGPTYRPLPKLIRSNVPMHQESSRTSSSVSHKLEEEELSRKLLQLSECLYYWYLLYHCYGIER